MQHWYSHPGRKVYYGADGPVSLHTATGVDQGDPLAGAVFCLGLSTPLANLQAAHPTISTISYHDDTYILVPPTNSTTSWRRWSTSGPKST